eukprot:Ihof_evm1s1284 gene=Ihof_evmTU1s1284
MSGYNRQQSSDNSDSSYEFPMDEAGISNVIEGDKEHLDTASTYNLSNQANPSYVLLGRRISKNSLLISVSVTILVLIVALSTTLF